MDADNWKWWYFVVAGVLLIAFGGYQVYELKIGKAIGTFVLAALAIFVGFASRGDDGDDDNQEEVVTPPSA